MERPAMLTRVLNDLYYMFRSTERFNSYIAQALTVILEAMEKHVSEKHIQISGRFGFQLICIYAIIIIGLVRVPYLSL